MVHSQDPDIDRAISHNEIISFDLYKEAQERKTNSVWGMRWHLG
jgi:hypothetical protein